MVLVGSWRSFQVGFDAHDIDVSTDLWSIKFDDIEPLFRPSASGRVELEYHSVRVSAKSTVRSSTKYYLIDVRITEMLRRTYDVATRYWDRAASTAPARPADPPSEELKGEKKVEHKRSWWRHCKRRGE